MAVTRDRAIPRGTPTTLSPRTRHARWLFSGLPANYDRVAEALSFGQNGRWRRSMVSRVRAGLAGRSEPLVLDVATGPAAVALELARTSDASVLGLDQSAEMLRAGIRNAADAGLADRVRFVLGQGEQLPFPDAAFDAVMFTYLLRYVDDPGAALAELARVVKPGGTVANLEFHVPPNPVWRGLWFLHTRVGLPLAGRLMSRSWFEVGRFLGPSISGFYRRHPLTDQLAMWRAVGVRDVAARPMSLGGGVVIWGTKAMP
jgi:demethylmenaquinone methyltransferase/2-methoxy-6-polyprenyl-1,4-benzoquinol methylase